MRATGELGRELLRITDGNPFQMFLKGYQQALKGLRNRRRI